MIDACGQAFSKVRGVTCGEKHTIVIHGKPDELEFNYSFGHDSRLGLVVLEQPSHSVRVLGLSRTTPSRWASGDGACSQE